MNTRWESCENRPPGWVPSDDRRIPWMRGDSPSCWDEPAWNPLTEYRWQRRRITRREARRTVRLLQELRSAIDNLA